ncbi:MAG: hypothetical protein E7253_11035 [Lachnospiraceae bacterium]|nr:hypothetical protein [Lachnospiraceae bacterium]
MYHHDYELMNRQSYIDKTSSLEKGIVVFPSIYIEGSAAVGKTTAVKMLLSKHKEVVSYCYSMTKCGTNKKKTELKKALKDILEQMQTKEIWVIFEDINEILSEDICQILKSFVGKMPDQGRAIFVGRFCQAEFLELVWKRDMELIPQTELLFTRNNIREYIDLNHVQIKADSIYDMTGGWPGCVDMMVRFADRSKDAKELRNLYEIDTYIDNEIIAKLSPEEKEIVSLGRICPWLTGELCSQIGLWDNASETLKQLSRKGIFYYNRAKEYYVLAKLFQKKPEAVSKETWLDLGRWYEKQNNLREAYQCVQKAKDEKAYRKFLYRYYDKIPFSDVRYDEVMNWYDTRPEICYLRGMYSYAHQYFDNLQEEIDRVRQWKASTEEEKYKKTEIYLNLTYANPNVSFQEWMDILEEHTKGNVKYRLYSVLGKGYSFLCGIRDISGLFSCSKKEENHFAKLWKISLGEQEWIAYCMARIDFYMETRQSDKLRDEDWRMLYLSIGQSLDDKIAEQYRVLMWRFRLAGLYLLCKWPDLEGTNHAVEHIHWMESFLLEENIDVCVRNTEAMVNLYSPWWNEPERLSRWLRYSEERDGMQITEDNYLEMHARAKGYLLLNYYDKAERILERLLPYLQTYHRYRYFAECLFGMAIVNWNKERKGQAIRNMMESFLVTGNSRYAGFYTRYGNSGREVLEGYIEWHKNTTPEGWHRKKKYNYGNILRMPMEDYLEVLLRSAKKENKISVALAKGDDGERLTMMETIILQSISKGLNNTEICEEQNLKMTTVKSHIYSLYKKLGVNSRVQAVNKGKEMGIVR